MSEEALLFVYGEVGGQVTEAEFADWYDNEHAPARLTVPGFKNALRYKAIDGGQPTWLALYDITSPSVITSDAYLGIRTAASDNERDIVSRTLLLQRRIYSLLSTHDLPTPSPSSPAKFLLVVSVRTTSADEAELNDWYENEHMGLMSKVPGFLRARRFKILERAELTGKAVEKEPCPYLAIYELDRKLDLNGEEFKHACSTPRAVKTLSSAVDSENRFFELYRAF